MKVGYSPEGVPARMVSLPPPEHPSPETLVRALVPEPDGAGAMFCRSACTHLVNVCVSIWPGLGADVLVAKLGAQMATNVAACYRRQVGAP